MRVLFACLSLIFALVIAAPASAQGFPPGPWRGIWTTDANPGYEYQAELDFTVENSGRVTGQFRWMLVRSPQHEEQPKIGMRAIEFIEGALDTSTGSLTLRGVRTDDPNGIIGPDTYRLAVSPNGQYIAGVTDNNGTWQGRIELTRFGPS
jgi:hypothetical protein